MFCNGVPPMIKKTIAIIGLTLSVGANAATLVISGGQLMGATGVDVSGALYDVSFVDGSCAGLFGGCDDYFDFAFTAQGQATLASVALWQSVFVNNASGEFDSVPQLTNGCTDATYCSVYTPFLRWASDEVKVVAFANFRESEDGSDAVFLPSNLLRTFDAGANERVVYAVWQPSPVPLPAAAWLFGSAILGLVGVARRKQA